jgi:hypothetical protein
MTDENLLPNANFGMAVVSSAFFSGTTAYAIMGDRPDDVLLATAAGTIVGLITETARASMGGPRNPCETLPVAGMVSGFVTFISLLALGAGRRPQTT